MFAKLALRNVSRSFRDYFIYFLTLMFGVCIFYVFNSIESQQTMMELNQYQHEMIANINRFMGYTSVFISVILGFLIVYANRFLIKRRKKELGIYQTLGMEKGQIAAIINLETLVVAVVSLTVGLAVGVFLSQGFAVITASLFEVKLKGFVFVFSPPAVVKALIYFGISFILVMLLSSVEIGRQKLIDLIYAERKNEKFKTPRLFLSVLMFFLSVIILIVAYWIINKYGLSNINTPFITSVALGITGTFLFFLSLSGFFLKLISQNKGVYLKGLNMFVLRQINSKINTTYISLTMVCLMLFVCICTLSSGMGLSKALTANTEKLTPYDATYVISLYNEEGYTVDVDIKSRFETAGVDFSKFAENMVEADYYKSNISILIKGRPFYPDFIKLSDYNNLLIMQGKQGITLAGNEFIINSNVSFFEEFFSDYFSDESLELNGKMLSLAGINNYSIENSGSPASFGEFIVNDDLISSDFAVRQNILAINYLKPSIKYEDLASESLEWFPALEEEENFGYSGGFYSRDFIFNNAKSSSVMIAYLGVYVGIVFLIISAAVLAITQLSESADNRERYNLLRKLGADAGMVNKALLSQIGLYFAAPLFLAIIHSIVGISVISRTVELIGGMDVLRDSIIAMAILAVVYGGYFLATYLGSKRLVMSRKG